MSEHFGTPERPIEDKADDALNRGYFVDQLAKSLVAPSGRSTGVIVGLTGSWGSGKSSILNLLAQNLKSRYRDQILVVSFDPWLISGRDDLITQFIAQIIGTINSEPKLKDRLKEISKRLAAYGSHLAPLGNFAVPGLGAALKGGFALAANALSKSKNLPQLRKELELELEKLGLPIVVMIDELDRVEDAEVRAVAQLVRAVADFRSVSYVLAFDVDRVTYALGGDGSKTERMERGKAYLEKIIQFQIPVPIALEEEISLLLDSSISSILKSFGLSDEIASNARYRKAVSTLTEGIISTPRDVKRMTETFHAVVGMVLGEVDWVDALVYCALLVKAPSTIELLRKNFAVVVQAQLSERSAIKRMALNQAKLAERLKLLMQDPADEGLARLLGLVFPFATETPAAEIEHEDAIGGRRALITMMRLGLPASSIARREIERVIRLPPSKMESALRIAYEGENFEEFYDRFSTIYLSSRDIDERSFWISISNFLRKRDMDWMSQYSPMHELVQNFASLFELKITRQRAFGSKARGVFDHFVEINERELLPHWVRSHIFGYHLFGSSGGSSASAVLSRIQTEVLAKQLGKTWRDEHLSGSLLQSRWDLQTVYTMIDVGAWDQECKQLLCDWMAKDVAVDAVALMLFGGHFSTGRDTVEGLCGWEFFADQAKARLASRSGANMSDSARLALKKGIGERS